MKYVLLTSIIILSRSSKAETLLTMPPDSAKISQLELKVQELTEQLKMHRVEENFYQTALGNQTTTYAAIVGSLLALAALVQFSIFNTKVSQLKRESREALRRQQEKFDTQEKKIEEWQLDYRQEVAKLDVIASDLYASDPEISAVYAIRAAVKFIKMNDEILCLGNLSFAEEQLKKCESNSNLDYLKEKLDECLKAIVTIQTSEFAGENVQRVCSMIGYRLSELKARSV